MGLFDIFKKNKSAGVSKPPSADKAVMRLAKVATDKHAQNYDRLEAIQSLGSIATAESAVALLRRFTFYIEPSITDQEEKETAFQGVLAVGENAIVPIRDFCLRAESLTWPMKLLEALLDDDGYVDELLALLSRFDTEYTKNVEPKLQIISALQGTKRDDVREAVEPFLQDVNEPVRFHAVSTIFALQNPDAAEALCRALVDEESLRVKIRTSEGLLAREWPVPEALHKDVAGSLPPAFRLEGSLVKKTR